MLVMKRVLVIDDAATRLLCKRWLEKEGYADEEAGNGLVGLERLQSDASAVDLCDIFMPLQNGIQTMTTIRADYVDVPLIAMTSGGPPGRAAFADAAEPFGVTATLEKPSQWNELIEAVSGVMP
jgi:CheY-like chemotaxis protein